MIYIGAKIKELRKRDGFTQEQLAEKLNVTPQTVSRWECETAYPDITAIPVLANIFKVSIDTLMGYDKEKIAERVEKIIRDASNYFWSDIKKCEKMLNDALIEYPDNDLLLRELLSLYESHIRTYQRNEYVKKAKTVARKLIAESTDIFVICSAKADLASIYMLDGRYKDAKELIDSLTYMYPYLLNDKMRCSSYMLKGEDKLREAKDWKLIEHQELFIACSLEGEGFFETESYGSALKSFIEATDIIERFMKSDKICPEAYLIYGTQANHMGLYLKIAACFFNLGKIDECENAIKRAYDILSLGYGEEFVKNPEEFLSEYRKTYAEYGLERYKPCI